MKAHHILFGIFGFAGILSFHLDHARALPNEKITVFCSGSAQNDALDGEKASAPVDPTGVTIELGEHTSTVTSLNANRSVSVRNFRTLQWGNLLIVFQNENAIGFVQRETGRVSINANINGNPGPVLFLLDCERPTTKF